MNRCIISLLFWVAVWRHAIVARPCRHLLIALVLLSTLNSQLSTVYAQGTAFLYQGRLNDGGSPAGGIYDLRFTIYDSTNIPGTVIAGPLTNSATAVSNGLFTVSLDFGPGIFTGLDRWLDIGVRTNGSLSAFTVLVPRQHFMPVPYAIFANTASNLSGSLPAIQLAGTLPASAFAGYTNVVALTNNGNIFRGTFNGTFGGNFNGAFFGNGGGVTNVNVTNLTGVLADSQLPSNTAFVNSNQTFSGANTFTGTNSFSGPNNFTSPGNNFVGSFFGNGLVGWIVTNGTAVQAEIDHGYLLTSPKVVTVTLPASPAVDDIVRISSAVAGGWTVAQNNGQAILGNFVGFTNSVWAASAAGVLAWTAMAASADGSKMAATAFGVGIYTSQNSGKTWNPTAAIGRQYRGIASSADGTKLAAVVTNDFIYTSTNSGGAWVQRTSGLPVAGAGWSAIASSASGARLVAVAYGDSIYTSTDSGATWVKRTSGLPSSANWVSTASSADGTKLVAVAKAGGIYTSTDSGATWVQRTSGLPSNPNWSSVASSADGVKLVAVVNGGGIYTSSDSGGTWTQRTLGLPVSAAWTSVASSADGGKLAATVSGGGIYTSVGWGVTWSQQSGEPAATWSAVVSSADGNIIAAAINSTISGGIYTIQSSSQTATTPGINGGIAGGQGTAVELQYIGNGLFMPVASTGIIWAL